MIVRCNYQNLVHRILKIKSQLNLSLLHCCFLNKKICIKYSYTISLYNHTAFEQVTEQNQQVSFISGVLEHISLCETCYSRNWKKISESRINIKKDIRLGVEVLPCQFTQHQRLILTQEIPPRNRLYKIVFCTTYSHA